MSEPAPAPKLRRGESSKFSVIPEGLVSAVDAVIAAINSEGGAPHAPLAPLNALVLALRGEGGHLSQEADVRTVAMVEALPQLPPLLHALRRVLAGREPKCRAAAVRVLRYLCHSAVLLTAAVDAHLATVYAALCLERDSLCVEERVQALKLFKALAAAGEPERVPPALLSAVVAVAGAEDDPLRPACLEALRLVAATNVATLSRRNALAPLLAAVVPPTENGVPVDEHAALPIVHTFAHLLDAPATRAHVHGASAVQLLLSPLAEIDTPIAERRGRAMPLALASIVALGRSWAGLIYLAADAHALPALLQILCVPNVAAEQAPPARRSAHAHPTPDAHHASPPPTSPPPPAPQAHMILDALFHLLRLGYLSRSVKPKTTNNSPTKMDTGSTSDEYAPSTLPSRRRRPDVLRLYIAFVVFALMHCGVLEVLVTLGSASDRLVAARAGELLRELLQLAASDALLPQALRVRLHQLASLTSTAMALRSGLADEAEPKSSGAARQANLVAAMLQQVTLMPGEAIPSSAEAAAVHLPWRAEWERSGLIAQLQSHGALGQAAMVDAARARIERLKMHQGMMNSEAAVFAALKDTGVLATKDYTQWNWRLIEALLHGPLRDPTQLKKVITSTKWVKRQLSFLRPEKDFLCNVRRDAKDAALYVRVSCTLIALLLSSQDGADYVAARFIKHLCKAIYGWQEAHEGDFSKAKARATAAAEEASGEGGFFGNRSGFKIPAALSARGRGESLDQGGDDSDDEGGRREGKYDVAALLSRDAISGTLTRHYLSMIGMLSAHSRGLKIMRDFSMWSMLQPLVQLDQRDDLGLLILHSLNFTRGSVDTDEAGTEGRSLLARCCRAPSAKLREAATHHLGVIAAAQAPEFADWGLTLLAGQLRDRDERVKAAALTELLEVCEAPEMLHALPKALVSARLDVDELPALCGAGEVETSTRSSAGGGGWAQYSTAPAAAAAGGGGEVEPWSMSRGYMLLLRFLEHPDGLAALVKQGWLKRELAAWKGGRCEGYLAALDAALLSELQKEPSSPAEFGASVVAAPPHLYGSLASTVEGCTILLEENALAAPIRLVVDDSAPPARRRAALMTVGHVGATEVGWEFLCDRWANLAYGLPPKVNPELVGIPIAHPAPAPIGCSGKHDLSSRASTVASSARSSTAAPALENRPSFVGQLMSMPDLGGRDSAAALAAAEAAAAAAAPPPPAAPRAAWGADAGAEAGDAAAAPAAAEASAPSALATLISLAEGAPCLSLRGAALFAVGLISGGSAHARAALTAAGWAYPERADACIALPTDPSRLLSLPDAGAYQGWDRNAEPPPPVRPLQRSAAREAAAPTPSREKIDEVLGHVSRLANQVQLKEAYNSLRGIAQREPAVVAHPLVLLEVHRLLAEHPFTLAVRRRLHALFDPAARALAFDD